MRSKLFFVEIHPPLHFVLDQWRDFGPKEIKQKKKRKKKWQNVKNDVVRSFEKRKGERKLGFLAHLIENQRANFVHFGSNFIW